jgi:cytochrome c-type biogenesis protein
MSIGSLVALYVAGLATFLTPCVLPMLPIYLGVLVGAQASGSRSGSRRRLHFAGIGFAVGLGSVFVLMGMGLTALTRSLNGFSAWFELILGTVMGLFGFKVLGWLRLPWFDREARPLMHRVPSVGGFVGGLLFGAGFAIGWTPCVGPVLGATLTYAATATSNLAVAGGMLAVYAAGLATPLVIGSFAASRLLVFTAQLRKYSVGVQRVSGAILLVFGSFLALSSIEKLYYPTGDVAGYCNANACDRKANKTVADGNVDGLPRGPVLVEFVSEHCTVCRKMRPVVLELEQSCTRGLIMQVSVDEPMGEKLAAHYGINMVPTFVSIDPTGGEVSRIVGEQSRQRLVLALNEVNGKPCEIRN